MESSAFLAPAPGPPSARRRSQMAPLLGVLLFLLIAAAALTWAKWAPYSAKLSRLSGTGVWSGHDVLRSAGAAGSAPSVSGAWAFTRAYFESVWKALVAGLLIAAGVQVLVPQQWLLRVLRRRGTASSSLVGGVLALPSLMCTCCTAPVAASLRRQGAPTSAALAYWVGNPVLNPAVLAFLALVAPWQWVATRIVVGVVLVVGATGVVARVAGGRQAGGRQAGGRQAGGRQVGGRQAGGRPAATEVSAIPLAAPGAFRLGAAPRAFVRSLARLTVTLVPEYLLVVFLLGLFRGWLFPLHAGAGEVGALAVLAAVVLGTLIVIPTAGEIPILLALAGAGAGAGRLGAGTIGALLITLPAISLVSMAMVVRAFGVRVTVAMAGAVAVCGLLGGLVLALLGG